MSDVLCATYSVYFRNRRTLQRVPGCDLTGRRVFGKWRRILRDTSFADLTIGLKQDGECCECFPEPHVDEMVIERHGDDDQVVWAGPVIAVTEDRPNADLRIEAADPSYWWSRRQAFQRSASFTDADIVDVWAAVRQDQDLRDPSGLLIVPGARDGRLITIEWDAFDDVTQVLRQIEDVSWTVVAGALFGPASSTIGEEPFATLNSSTDWVTPTGASGPVIRDDGATTSTEVVVIAANGIVGRYPEPGTPPPVNGLHIARVQRPNITTQLQADREARTLWERNRFGQTTLTTSESSLRRGSKLCVEDLIPGRRFLVESPDTCRPDFFAAVELTQAVGDFEMRNNNGRGELVETRVAVDFGPIGNQVDPTALSA